jgi:hypothetical protein
MASISSAVSGASWTIAVMNSLFLGSEALANGVLTRHELSRWYTTILRDVYVDKRADLTPRDKAEAGYLWSRRRAVITGIAASGLLGAAFVRAEHPVELIYHNSRRHPGLVVRNERIAADEVALLDGLPVATPARAAFDIGRHLPTTSAVTRLDALSRASGLISDDVLTLADRYRGARGLRRLNKALTLMDPGSQSPKETWLRLLFYNHCLPPPVTQIPVRDGGFIRAYLDLGWPQFKVAAEYDGDHHRSDRTQYVKDIRRRQMLQDLGWIVIYVVAEDPPMSIVNRAVAALRRRGFAEVDTMQRVARTSAA